MTSTAILVPTEQIAARLRGEVLNGRFRPGEPLREVALSEQFGVGRAIVRQALGQLVHEGLLVGKRNCGVAVADAPSETARELLTPLRVQIETYALRLCFASLDDAAFAEWDAMLTRMRHACELRDRAAILDADFAFHRSILVRAGLEEMVPVWQPVISRLRAYHDRGNRTFKDDDLLLIHAIHVALVKVFRRGEWRVARQALQEHLENGGFNQRVQRAWYARKRREGGSK